MLAIGVLAVVSMTLGLLISASVNTSDKTMPLLVVAVMFQVVLTGGVFPLAGKAGLEQVAWLSPSRWGFAATASTVNLNVISLPVIPKVPAVKQPAPGKSHAPHAKHSPAPASSHATPKAPHGTPSALPTQAHKTAKAHKPAASHGSAKAHASPSAAPSATPGTATQTATADSSSTVDPLWKHSPRTWLIDMAMMVLLGLAFTLIAWWRLVKLSPGRRK